MAGGAHRPARDDLEQAAAYSPLLDVDEAADAFFALVSQDVYLLLVDDCGWDWNGSGPG